MFIGYSTGAVAFGDFRLALDRLAPLRLHGVELSALRAPELAPLIDALDTLDLQAYEYVSIHAPSRYAASEEKSIIAQLQKIAETGWPIICHPDSISNPRAWAEFGSSLCFENMDKRKPIGRTADELELVFGRFPMAKFCIDLGHAWQIDRTMSEASEMIRRFHDRIIQVHVSEVNTNSEHKQLTRASVTAFNKVVQQIPVDATWIIESVIENQFAIVREVEFLQESLGRHDVSLIPD
ncbi:MAG TPA: hypothetical protein VHY37_00380 [Tepidisphaeraceae bacterium]|nr:hypothetical protein [Tepidisphaeraceae bacterium]